MTIFAVGWESGAPSVAKAAISIDWTTKAVTTIIRATATTMESDLM
jgi:hypothetical protein